jgi:hypothetical protein
MWALSSRNTQLVPAASPGSAEEEQPLDAGGEAGEVQQEAALVLVRADMPEREDLVGPALAELGFPADGRNVLDRGESLRAPFLIRHIVVEERQVELDVQRLLVKLARQVHASLGRVDVPVQADHEIVRYDRVAGREERHQPLDEVPLRGRHALAQVSEIDLEVDLLHGPGVLDGGAVHLVEARIAHRAQRQVEPGIQELSGRSTAGLHLDGGAHWQASQLCGFSSEQATAPASEPLARTVAFAILVAGRERR